MDKEDIHILRLMGEIERDDSPSQRELSHRLGLSLGLVNSFVKRLVNKGYFKLKTMPRNRVKYLLTPKGLARKSMLTVEYLQYSAYLYKEVKNLLVLKFKEMEDDMLSSVLFFGAGEVADLAYLYLQMTNIRLVGIIDDHQDGGYFFEFRVDDFGRLSKRDWDKILLTRLDNTDQDVRTLVEHDVSTERIAIL
ncbi:MAG: winged helix-turn-helix transcriptional regulator [Deltaproteobacteria bacterium]|nr:winged helix-turn-helix transcriptional regulator [Deltaproteobacteria bacterium]MBW2120123.1 winged helix-turn-helix transcriptional regulator [Deltaproteobacteria bacterium]MBW2342574.1 winged helix-turn-helix transcriptional regulator [Deltaproteobacteria bacterium]